MYIQRLRTEIFRSKQLLDVLEKITFISNVTTLALLTCCYGKTTEFSEKHF